MTAPRTCGVLGDPIAHSLSPVLHRAAYAELGLDWTYEAHRVPAGGLADFLAGLDEGWRGLSLTMPLKREAFELADRVTDRARLAGAVNTLVLDGDVAGDNTDLPGAVAAIRERADVDLATAVVLGGGATATSVGLALLELGVRQIEVRVRTEARAAETVEALRAHPAAAEVSVAPLTSPGDRRVGSEGPDVVVSTVPAAAQTDEVLAGLLDAPCTFEVVYDPWPTPLARATRGVLVSGLDLLVHQAALQLSLFTGLPAPLAAMREAGERALSARSGETPG